MFSIKISHLIDELSAYQLSMEDNNTNTDSFSTLEIALPRPVRFWLLLIFVIPAIICSLIHLFYFICNRKQRHALHNHTLLILISLALVFQLIDVTWYLDFIQRGITWPQTPARCLVWWLVDLGFYNTAALILAWASIERHILVFHDRWLATNTKRFFVHYCPLISLLTYAIIYYTILIFFPPCENIFIYELPVCAAMPCHLTHPILGFWEMGVHGCLCTIIIAIANLSLIIRVLIRKRHHNQMFNWKKYRKMIIQLVSISILYLCFNLPVMSFMVANRLGLPADVAVQEQLTFFFLTYWVLLLLPIISLMSLPGWTREIKILIRRYKQHRGVVMPASVDFTLSIRQ